MRGASTRPLRIAVDPGLEDSAPEIAYVFRTMLTTAGYPWRLEWADASSEPTDIEYGEAAWGRAPVRIPAVRWQLRDAARIDPVGTHDYRGVPLLRFAGDTQPAVSHDTALQFPTDLVAACYWWLTGAREPTLGRDRRDNLDLGASIIATERLLARPIVSLAAQLLR